MNLNSEKINQMDSKEIYKLLLPSIKKLYQSFSYINLTYEEYYNLVLFEIDDSRKKYKNNPPYNDFIKNKIKSVLNEKTAELLHNPKTQLTLI